MCHVIKKLGVRRQTQLAPLQYRATSVYADAVLATEGSRHVPCIMTSQWTCIEFVQFPQYQINKRYQTKNIKEILHVS